DLLRQLCVVSLGHGPVGLQPARADGTDLTAGLLGAHRIRLRKVLDSAQALDEHPSSDAWPIGDFSQHAASFHRQNPTEGTGCRGSGPVSAARSRKLAPFLGSRGRPIFWGFADLLAGGGGLSVGWLAGASPTVARRMALAYVWAAVC